MLPLDENTVITTDNSNTENVNKNMEFIVDCDSTFINDYSLEEPKKPAMSEILQHLSELESEKQEIMHNLQKPDLDEKSKSMEENLLKAVNIMIKNIHDYLQKEQSI